jgi:hypothetical protein
MGAPKGRPKPIGAGRTAGTLNKKTASLRDELKAKNFDIIQRIVDLLDDPKTFNRDKIDLLKMVVEYTHSKPAQTKEPNQPTFQANNIQVAMMRQSTAELEAGFLDTDLERELMEDED